jgi:hypothetical protein
MANTDKAVQEAGLNYIAKVADRHPIDSSLNSRPGSVGSQPAWPPATPADDHDLGVRLYAISF